MVQKKPAASPAQAHLSIANLRILHRYRVNLSDPDRELLRLKTFWIGSPMRRLVALDLTFSSKSFNAVNIPHNENPHGGTPMFAELMPLLRKRRLLLTVSIVEGDTIRATVVPQKATDTDDNAVTTPLAITGTAEELDRDLPQQLVEFTGAHLQLQTTLASAKAEMEAAAKAAREEARKKTSKPSSASSPTTPVVPAATTVSREPEAPSLFAPQAQPETTAAEVEEEEGGEAS